MISPEEHLNCKVHDRRGCAHRDTSLSSARSESPNARVITPELWRNRICIRYAGASTSDQLLYSALHGTAMRYAAERRNLDESIEELRRSRTAGTTFSQRRLASLRALGMPARPLTSGMS
jgi:hypothetical protein